MDVRCENCETVYELEESKLKPGGVTVKCTACGHMFKVRRSRTSSQAVVARPRSFDDEPTRRRQSSSPGSGDGEPVWLVRLSDGEIKTCRELATLQRWIVSGQVGRSGEISRTGKKWKPLSDIAELASFFQVADEVHHGGSIPQPVRTTTPGVQAAVPPRRQTSSHPHTIPREPVANVGTDANADANTFAASQSVRFSVGAVPPGATEEVTSPSALEDLVVEDTSQGGPRGWAMRDHTNADSDESGPTGGKPMSNVASEAAFARTTIQRDGEFEQGRFVAMDDADDYLDDLMPRRSGIGKWIALVSLMIMVAGAVVLYNVLRQGTTPNDEKQAPVATTEKVTPVVPDAAAKKVDTTTLPTTDLEEKVKNELVADTAAGLELVLEALSKTDPATKGPSLLALQARVETALGQHLADQAEDATGKAKRKLLASKKTHATAALKLADKVLSNEPSHVGALVAKARALTLRGSRGREIERWLRKALKAQPHDRDALVSRGLMFVRDNRLREARTLFDKIDNGSASGDVRPRYRLSLLDFADKSYEAAAKGAALVLEAQPEHAGAAALQERIRAATSVVTTDRMPDEESGGPSGVDSYDRLLERADRLAEGGNCSKAIVMYNKALDANPSGVGGLTGLGYCYLDGRKYASAHAKFRAALGISSRYQDALWGVAEAYDRQSLKPQAIAAYRRFIDKHPRSKRAEAAKRHIGRLGGGAPEPKQPAPQVPKDDTKGSTGTGDGAPKTEPDPSAEPAKTEPVKTEPPKTEPPPGGGAGGASSKE